MPRSYEQPTLVASLFKIEHHPTQRQYHYENSSIIPSFKHTVEARIFGRLLNEENPSCCIRIPDIFPYFYLDYEGGPTNVEEAKIYIETLGKTIYEMIRPFMSTSMLATENEQSIPFQIILVKGMPFYGFHKRPKLYLKVIVHQPHLKTSGGKLASVGSQI